MTPRSKRFQSAPEKTEADLRQNAEKVMRQTKNFSPEKLEGMSSEEIWNMFHELQVHQIELEMQNTELRRTQEELEVARSRYFELYDLAPVGYCTLNQIGLILEANLTVMNMLGVTRATLVKSPLSNYILKEDQDIYYHHRKKLLETGEPQIFELRMAEEASTPKWMRLDTNLVLDDAGAPIFQIALTDISERKEMEEDNVKLEAQNRQVQKMESIGRLAGGIAHDFNNKLAIILGNVELILEQVTSNESIIADLEEIRNAARHSADLTRQLLAFARKQIVTPKVLDLNDTVNGMLSMLERLIGENIVLTWRPQTDLWSVKMDSTQIDQILTNLCINARDAIMGTGTLTIETGNIVLNEAFCADHPGCSPGYYVLLTVTDDGCGVEQETLAKIFEPFFTTKEMDKGTGLGLATVYGIVKQNNGFIDVSSTPGLGTTFKIYMPRYVIKTKEMPADDEILPVIGGRETILLVEDDPSILKMTARILKDLGYTVLSANGSKEATHLAEVFTGKIHLILTDVIMPEMNGKDLVQELVTIYPQIKSLFMSGYTFNIMKRQGQLDNNIYFIQKPFTKKQLAVKIRETLD